MVTFNAESVVVVAVAAVVVVVIAVVVLGLLFSVFFQLVEFHSSRMLNAFFESIVSFLQIRSDELVSCSVS